MQKLVSTWIMMVPVISTAHMPSTDAIHMLPYDQHMLSDSGGMVFVDDTKPHDPPWVREIAEKVSTSSGWVRLHADGPILEGLTTYKWVKGEPT